MLQLPQTIRQEDGSRDECVRVFSEMDSDSSGIIDLSKFISYVDSLHDNRHSISSSPDSQAQRRRVSSVDSVSSRTSRLGRSSSGDIDGNVYVEDADSGDEDAVVLHLSPQPITRKTPVVSNTRDSYSQSSPLMNDKKLSGGDRRNASVQSSPNPADRNASPAHNRQRDARLYLDDSYYQDEKDNRHEFTTKPESESSSRLHTSSSREHHVDSNFYLNDEKVDKTFPARSTNTTATNHRQNVASGQLQAEEIYFLDENAIVQSDQLVTNRSIQKGDERLTGRDTRRDVSSVNRQREVIDKLHTDSSSVQESSKSRMHVSASKNGGDRDTSSYYRSDGDMTNTPVGRNAASSSTEGLRDLSGDDIFRLIDRNKDGELTLTEFIYALRKTPAVAEV